MNDIAIAKGDVPGHWRCFVPTDAQDIGQRRPKNATGDLQIGDPAVPLIGLGPEKVLVKREDIVAGANEAIGHRNVIAAEEVDAVSIHVVRGSGNDVHVLEAQILRADIQDAPRPAAGDARDAIDQDVAGVVDREGMPIADQPSIRVLVNRLRAVVENGAPAEDFHIFGIPDIDATGQDRPAGQIERLAAGQVDIAPMQPGGQRDDIGRRSGRRQSLGPIGENQEGPHRAGAGFPFAPRKAWPVRLLES